MRLKERVAIITGAGDIEGIGAAIAIAYAKEGAKILIADIVNGEQVVQSVEKAGGNVIFTKTDVTKQDECNAMAKAAVDGFGTIDILVNNAAIYRNLVPKPFTEVTTEEWNRVMEVNTTGPFHCTKSVFPYMKKKGGKIINISSDVVIAGVTGLPHYVASKGAVFAFSRCMARELGEFNIKVNSIAPGYTQSGASKNIEKNRGENINEHLVQMRCLKRSQLPEDLVGTAIFLASRDSDFMTGQYLNVNGGMNFH
jgi:NAD(P)-dependent dehydrogenase (short-subunit alcohol dehydrogenase family)